jgi:hypothetical protein
MSIVRLSAALAAVAFSIAPAQAALTVYSGFDAGASAPGANAVAARNAFVLAVPGTTLDTFESATPGANTNGVARPGYVFSSVAFNFQVGTTCTAALCGDNTTPGGRVFAYSNAASASLTFNFTSPVSAFGAYFGGVQTATNAIVFTSGGSQVIPLNTQNAIGGFSFVGFSDPSALITSVQIDIPFDLISVDDVMFKSAAVALVPEPATWAMMLFGFGFTGAMIRRRKVSVTYA